MKLFSEFDYYIYVRKKVFQIYAVQTVHMRIANKSHVLPFLVAQMLDTLLNHGRHMQFSFHVYKFYGRATLTNQALVDREETFRLLSAFHSTSVSTPLNKEYQEGACGDITRFALG